MLSTIVWRLLVRKTQSSFLNFHNAFPHESLARSFFVLFPTNRWCVALKITPKGNSLGLVFSMIEGMGQFSWVSFDDSFLLFYFQIDGHFFLDKKKTSKRVFRFKRRVGKFEWKALSIRRYTLNQILYKDALNPDLYFQTDKLN